VSVANRRDAPKQKGTTMQITSIGNRPAYDPEKERIAGIHAREDQRLGKVYAMAVGELKRLAPGVTPDASGRIDTVKLDAALSGKPLQRRLVLKSMLAELGMIPL
jgi:hypothetical protein